MSRFPTVPDFDPTNLASLGEVLRALKDISEQLAGLRQGESLGSPLIFFQEGRPLGTARSPLKIGDLWVSSLTYRISVWRGFEWMELTAEAGIEAP